MSEGPNIVRVAALIGDNARAEILTALMSDRAMTATELAHLSGVTRQTASFHLGKLLEEGLVVVDRQGRHRYFRIAGSDVAELIESIMGVAFRSGGKRPVTGPRDPGLRRARICYDHLAGEVSVELYEAMLRHDVLRNDNGGIWLTDRGRRWFGCLGVDTDALDSRKRIFCRPCLDWSERRHHLAGALGAALLGRLQALGWAARTPDSRTVTLTQEDEESLWAMFTRAT
ncbi:hypothetical protein KBTX_01665 [wastewater metagenome]|uniref:HTH arsR-type domain-containing protein n=2 Tax=unclassified sequences TaxID=12908 RepID=A0A5B8RET6_9ZZZZ|nr:helix-turn-helix domain-containing protein [Arhodomonas sp. KWT]QEA05345.1 hypothetical protein KBTEX_01665 [uncultured organism]